MRKGWDEMSKEQHRIGDGLVRPIWQATGNVPVEKPNARQQQKDRLLQMRASLRDKISRLDAEATKLEDEAQQAELQLERLADVGLALTAIGRGKLLGASSASISRPPTVGVSNSR